MSQLIRSLQYIEKFGRILNFSTRLIMQRPFGVFQNMGSNLGQNDFVSSQVREARFMFTSVSSLQLNAKFPIISIHRSIKGFSTDKSDSSSDIPRKNSPTVNNQDCSFIGQNVDIVEPAKDSSSGAENIKATDNQTIRADVSTTGTTCGTTGTTCGEPPKQTASGFCADVTPNGPDASSVGATSDEATPGGAPPVGAKVPPKVRGPHAGQAPDIKLPDRKQVERTFFRILAYIYDFTIMAIEFVRKIIQRYIITNPEVQKHWRTLRGKMEASKKA